jgi:hypothetical protein
MGPKKDGMNEINPYGIKSLRKGGKTEGWKDGKEEGQKKRADPARSRPLTEPDEMC